VQTKDGIREWRLTAGSAHFSKQHNQTRLENVTFTYFTKDQKQVVMTGKEGSFNTESLDVELCGNVEIKTDEGYEFRAPSVKYVAKVKEIRSSDEVMFKGNQLQVIGKGMRVFISQGKLIIMSTVQAIIMRGMEKRDRSS
jgi:LPS export ABC transporter protein LptC